MTEGFADVWNSIKMWAEGTSPPKRVGSRIGKSIGESIKEGMNSETQGNITTIDPDKIADKILPESVVTAAGEKIKSRGSSIAMLWDSIIETPTGPSLPAENTSVEQVLASAERVDTIISSARNTVEQIMVDVGKINKALSEIPDLDVTMKLEKIGQVLGVKNDVLKIETKPVNIPLNLKVTMEADKIADVLIETKKIMPAIK